MSEEQKHIDQLFNERGKNDANSTTLANTLDKDIQTVFNSPDKFILELLQNAEDATDQNNNQPINVTFKMIDRYLIFSHTGKHFDQQDVVAICDNAQQHLMQKKLNLNKIGYKGVGFKSVFVISECVYIKSKKYSFRFDSKYSKWNDSSQNTRRYPWQIIPIWTDYQQLPRASELNDEHVNFIFEIKENKLKHVPKVINDLLENPRTILFLRNIRKIEIKNFYDRIQCIEVRKSSDRNDECLLYINAVEKSRWFLTTKKLDLEPDIRNKLQQLKDQECPAKLKKATSVDIQFAVQLSSNGNVVPLKKSEIFCYMPTKFNCNLPFLVNADFLLSADRMQLLSNFWNEFLFECIGVFHIQLLQTMALKEQYRNDILKLFIRNLKSNFYTQFDKAYHSGLWHSIGTTKFIPSHPNPSQLLNWNQAIRDDTGFFKKFSNIDSENEKYMASYTLKEDEKLNDNNFTVLKLAAKIESYAEKCLIEDRYKQLLECISLIFNKKEVGNLRYLLNRKKFLRTCKDVLVSSNDIYLPLDSDSQLQHFLISLNANFIHPELLSIPDLQPWLKMIGVTNITDDALIKIINEWISSDQGRLANIEPKNSVDIIRLLNSVDTKLIKGKHVEMLPLRTTSGKFNYAKLCYLPSVLHPKFDLEKIAGSDVDLVDISFYDSDSSDKNKLKSTLIALKVKQDIPFVCKTIDEKSDISDIDYFDEYIQNIKSNIVNKVIYYECHMAYSPYMRYLEVESYAKVFLKLLHQHEKDIIDGMENFKIRVNDWFSPKIYDAKDDVEHYLKFMLNRKPCILGKDDKLYRMKDFYLSSITKKLDAKFKRNLPKMKTKFDNFTIKISNQLMQLLGARQELSPDDAIKLFDLITDQDSDEYYQLFNSLYKLICTASWNTSQDEKHRRHQLKLLATDGSRQPAASLYYFSCQHLCMRGQPSIFKSFADISKEEELSLCNYFGVQILQDSDYNILKEQSSRDIELNKIKNLLKYIVISVNKSNTIQDMNEKYLRWINSLQKLQIVPVEGLKLQVKSDQDKIFKADFILSADHLYYEEKLHLAEYIEAIAEYIKLPPEQIKDLKTFALMPDLMLKRYMENNNYDTSAVAKLGRRYSVSDDSDDPNSNLAGTPTSEGHLSPDNDMEITPTTSDTTVAREAQNANAIFTSRSQDYNNSENWGQEPDAKRFRSSQTDSTHLITDTGNSDPSSSSIDNFRSEEQLSAVSHFNTNDSNSTLNQQIGKLGEKFAYEQFIKHYKGKLTSIENNTTDNDGKTETTKIDGIDKKGKKLSISLTWCNCYQESCEPFDIKLIKNGRPIWIEVKSTSKSQTIFLKMSRDEYKTMCKVYQDGQDYRLCLVYNVSIQEDTVPIMKQIKSPASKLLNGKITPRETYYSFDELE